MKPRLRVQQVPAAYLQEARQLFLPAQRDGPPLVSCAALCVRNGKLTEANDAFAHPFWDEVRSHVARKAIEMRRQGFAGAAMLPMSELEYTGCAEKLADLELRFRVRGEAAAAVA